MARYLSTGDRQVGVTIVGEKPAKSPGDTSDLPPTGEQLREPTETDVPRYKRFGREVTQELEDVNDAGQEIVETARNVFSQATPSGYAGAVPHDATIANIPTAAPDPGSIASLVVVSGVLGVRAAEAAHGLAIRVAHGAGKVFHTGSETFEKEP